MNLSRNRSSPDKPDANGAPQAGLSPLSLVALAVAIGLISGFLDLGILELKTRFFDRRFAFELSTHHVWTVPLAALFPPLVLGVLFALGSRLRKKQMPRFWSLWTILTVAIAVPPARLAISDWACLIAAAGIASLASRFLSRRPRSISILTRFVLPLLAFSLVVAISYDVVKIYEPYFVIMRSPPRAEPNVLLIVMDTVRADALNLHDEGADKTPALKAISQRGVVFENAFSTAPWTLPSIASMLTGEWPHRLSCGIDKPLDDKKNTLAGHLDSLGYDNAAFVANGYYLGKRSGLARGFQYYDDYPISPVEILRESRFWQRLFLALKRTFGIQDYTDLESLSKTRTAKSIRDDLCRWIDGRSQKRPFFAFLNLFEAHTPYIPPRTFRKPSGRHPLNRADFATLRDWNVLQKDKLTHDQVTLARDSYADCIGAMDEQIGLLMKDLETRGLLENTIVIITSDHGEHFGEHGLYGHGCSLYTPLLRVPLLMVGPGVPNDGRRIKSQVSLRDLAATVEELVEPKNPGRHPVFPGRSLAEVWKRSADANSSSPILAEVQRARWDVRVNQGKSANINGSLITLFAEGKHLILDSTDHAQLFDLKGDPEELTNLAPRASSQLLIDRLRQSLEDLLGEGQAAQTDR